MDSGWIKALELPARITGGLFFGCLVVFFLDDTSALQLEEVASWLRPAMMIVCVISGCLFLASLFADGFAAGSAYLRRRAESKEVAAKEHAMALSLKKRQEAAVAHLDHLSETENYEAATALRGGSPSFESWAHSTGAGQLMAKGLIYSPSGTYNGDHFPFTFYDFAWEALQERREAILQKEAKYEQHRKKFR